MSKSRATSQPIPHQASALEAKVHEALRLYEAGRMAEARQLCQAILKQDERSTDGWHLLGMIARGDGRLDIAIDCLRKAVALRPDLTPLRNNLANALKESGQVEQALAQYEIGLKQQPTDPLLLSNIGSACNQLRRFAEAKEYFTQAITLKPDYADAWYNLAVIHSTLGEDAGREEALEKALQHNPAHAQAYHLKVQSQKTHAPELLKTMEALSKNSVTPPEDKVQLAFALGKALEDMGRAAEAFAWFREGNRIKRWGYTFDIHHTESQFEWIKRLITPQWIAEQQKNAYAERTPLFIVGMPRSGTSLVEQILAQHEEVHGGGELFYLRDLLGAIEREKNLPYPLCVANSTPEAVQKVAKDYAEQLFALAPGKRYVTDKLPGNFCHAGLIAGIFNGAKIIHIQRDALDNGLSIYKLFFGDNLPYAYDQWETGSMIRLCRQLMAHWEKILSEDVLLTVKYETLVEHPEQEIRRMLEFLGLPWEEACLNFHASTRPVTTASVNQVRRPMYKTAIRASEKYAEYLKPMLAAIEG